MAEKLIKKLNNREFYAKYSDYAAMDEDGERLSDRKVKSVELDAASGTMTVTSTDGSQEIPVVPDAPHTQGLVLRTNADGTYAWGAAGAEPGRGRLLMRLGSAPEATDTGFNANSETDVTVEIPVASAVEGGNTDGLMPSSDKSKLDGIEPGAQANKIETVQLNGTTVMPTGTTVNIQLDKSSVGLGNVENTSDRDKPISTATQSALDGKADKATTLAGYGITDAYTKTEIGTLLDGKVDTVSGKGLSTNDYTDADKGKLDNIESGAEVNLIESVSVAGTALKIESKSVNVPEAGGTTGAWVKGVVSGEDTARWDSWEDISVTIPDHSLDGFLYLTYFENLELYNESKTADTPVIGDITYYAHYMGYGTVPSTINEYVASAYTGLPAMTVLASSSRRMLVENRQGFERNTVLDLLQSVETFSFEVILNIGSFDGLWGGLAFGCSAGESNYGMNVNVYESSRGLGIGLPGWYGSGTNRCTATSNFDLKSYDSGRDVHALSKDVNKRRGIGIHHLAVVVDRTANEARGYFDGELAIRRPTISEIGSIVNYSFTNEMNDTLQYTQFAIREGDCSTNGGLNYPVPTKPYVKF